MNPNKEDIGKREKNWRVLKREADEREIEMFVFFFRISYEKKMICYIWPVCKVK